MALNLEELKKIDQQIQHIVFGFVRQCQSLLPDHTENAYYTIPSLAFYLCLSYFHSAYLDKNNRGKYMKVNEESNSVSIDKGEEGTHVTDWSMGNTIYGNQWLRSNSNMKYEYELEITHIHPSYSDVYIGISSKDVTIQDYVNDNVSEDCIYYAQTNWGSTYTNHNSNDKSHKAYSGKPYTKSGDILRLMINFKEKTVKLSVNNDEEGACFTNIKIGDDIEYKLAISIYRHGDTVTVKAFHAVQG